jgi:DNA-binding MarR family transcriptional regulator
MSRCYCILLRKASRKLSSLYDDALEPIGINVAQFSLLRHIERGQPISITELGRQTELERSTVSRNIKVLEGMDLVATSAGADQREAVVELTDNGRNILQDGAPLWQGAQGRELFKLSASSSYKRQALLTFSSPPPTANREFGPVQQQMPGIAAGHRHFLGGLGYSAG